MKKKNINYRILFHIVFFILLSATLFLVLSSPLSEYRTGDDGLFHFYRFEYLYNSVKNLQFFNGFYEKGFLSDFGYPMGIFYPQAFLYLFVLLAHALQLSAINGFILMMFLLFVGGFISSYFAFLYLMKEHPEKEWLSFTGASVYTLIPSGFNYYYLSSSYFMTTLFARVSIGESLALLFFPWVIVGLVSIVRKNGTGLILAASLLGILYSHVLSGVVIAPVVILYLLYHIKTIAKDREIRKRILFSFLVFVLVGAYQMFPMLDMMLHQSYGYSIPIMDRFDLYATAIPFGDFEGELLSLRYYPIIQLLTGAALIGLFIKYKKTVIRLFIASLMAFYLSSKLFPWQYLIDSPLKVMQFPFRFNSLFSLLLAFAAVYLLKKEKRRLMPGLGLLYILILITLLPGVNTHAENGSKFRIPIIQAIQLDIDRNYIGGGAEYLPSNFDITGIDRERGINSLLMKKKLSDLKMNAEKDPYLIPHFYYKGIKIYDEGQSIEYNRGYSGLIETVKPVKSYKIQYERTPVQKISFSITILTILVIILIRKNPWSKA